jgi:hypothetical protein
VPKDIQLKLWFENDEERQRYWRLKKQPEMAVMAGKGAWMAETFPLPRIYGNNGVFSQDRLCEMTREFLEAGFTDIATELTREPTDDERFMFRMGYQALTLEALESHYRAARAGQKLGEGLALALDGNEACNEGLRLLGEVKPPVHLLSVPTGRSKHGRGERLETLRSRPLRPEDFGCLPQGPRLP